MTTLYEQTLTTLESRHLEYVRNEGPFFAVSIGCHIFNIINKHKEIYTKHGLPVDTRFHILKAAPAGWGKSEVIRQFLKPYMHSILHATEIQTSIEGSTTEAGLVGTVKFDSEGNVIVTEGLCKSESESIVGIEEFSAITRSMRQLHNAGLDTALLTALDDGAVVKRLASGVIKYPTFFSLWAGVQPARFDLSSGMARRLGFIVFIPTREDIIKFREAGRKSDNVAINMAELNKLKDGINKRRSHMERIKSVDYTEKFYEVLNEISAPHFEELIYKRIGLGYTIMTMDSSVTEIKVDMDEELKRILLQQKKYRTLAKYDPNKSQVWQIIKDQKTINIQKLTEQLVDYFSLSLEEIQLIFEELQRMGWIKKDGQGNFKITK